MSWNELINEDALRPIEELVKGALALRADTFREIHLQHHSLLAALTIVFWAGVSQSLSQIVVLFINQVRPLRFVLSLLISALFFVIGFGFWALSIWAILNLTFDVQLSFVAVLRTLGFSYSPLLLGVFVIFPYFGSAVFVLLSIWTLLAVVIGIEAITDIGRWDAVESAVLGWVVLQLLQQTVGQPIATLGQWITNWVAGENLITNRARLAEELYEGLRFSQGEINPYQTPLVHRSPADMIDELRRVSMIGQLERSQLERSQLERSQLERGSSNENRAQEPTEDR